MLLPVPRTSSSPASISPARCSQAAPLPQHSGTHFAGPASYWIHELKQLPSSRSISGGSRQDGQEQAGKQIIPASAGTHAQALPAPALTHWTPPHRSPQGWTVVGTRAEHPTRHVLLPGITPAAAKVFLWLSFVLEAVHCR